MAWVGGFTSGFINMTFPSLFYIVQSKDKKMTFTRGLAYFILGFSLIVTLLTIESLFVSTFF